MDEDGCRWMKMCFIFVSLDVQIFHLTWTRLAAVETGGREGGGWGQIFGINWVGSLLGVALIWRLPTGPATAVVMAKGRLILIAAMAILTQGRSLISSDVYIMSVYYRHSKIWSFLANPCAFLFLVFSVLSNWGGCQKYRSNQAKMRGWPSGKNFHMIPFFFNDCLLRTAL